MRFALVVTLSSLVMACSGAATSTPPPVQANQPSPAFTPQATIAATAPFISIPADRMQGIESSLVSQYTVPYGQQNYDGRVIGDILATRYFIYDRESGRKGGILRLDGIIRGIVMQGSTFYYQLTPFNRENGQAFTYYVKTVLPAPDINYEAAPPEIIISNSGGADFSKVGLMGTLEPPPPLLADPYSALQAIPAEDIDTLAQQEDTIFSYQFNGTSFYLAPKLRPPLGKESFTVEIPNLGTVEIPLAGTAVLQHIIVDTQAPDNQRIFTGIPP